MSTSGYVVGFLALLAAAYFGQRFWVKTGQNVYRNKLVRTMETYNEIRDHAKEFDKKEIIKVGFGCFPMI